MMIEKMKNAFTRPFHIIEHLCEAKGGISFRNLCMKHADIPSASMTRLLSNLCEHGYARKTERGLYRIGESFLKISRKAADHRSLEEILDIHCHSLADTTGKSSAFFEWEGDAIRLLAKHEMPAGFHYKEKGETNIETEIHDFAVLCRAFDKSAIPPKTIDAIHSRGFAYRENEPDPILHRIAAPVFIKSIIFGAIGISFYQGNAESEEIKRLGKTVCKTAQNLTAILSNK